MTLKHSLPHCAMICKFSKNRAQIWKKVSIFECFRWLRIPLCPQPLLPSWALENRASQWALWECTIPYLFQFSVTPDLVRILKILEILIINISLLQPVVAPIYFTQRDTRFKVIRGRMIKIIEAENSENSENSENAKNSYFTTRT